MEGSSGANSGVKYLIQDSVLVDPRQLPEGARLNFEQQVGWFLQHRSAKRELVQPGSGAQVYPVAFEYQVIDDRKHIDALYNASSRAGALYRMAAPSQSAARPARRVQRRAHRPARSSRGTLAERRESS